MIHLKRAYDDPSPDDGLRILVERLWPRGVTREHAALDLWAKEVAPSPALRKWFSHDPAKWGQFKRRYWQELSRNPDAIDVLRHHIRKGPVTFVYAAHDERYNAAVALNAFLGRRKGRASSSARRRATAPADIRGTARPSARSAPHALAGTGSRR